jgi:hypothetical protein
VAPLTFTLALLTAQLAALVASLRAGLWRAVPAWTIYIVIATIHLGMGLVMNLGFHQDYPLSILYLEPLLIMGQIAFAFEASMKYLHRSSSSVPERRILLWLIPLIPAAVVLPAEVGFVQDAVANWTTDEGESLKVLFAVRKFLAMTLMVILALVPIVARLARKAPSASAVIHHRVLTTYLACSVLGYVSKASVGESWDRFVTNLFFIAGPIACFVTWSLMMWKIGPRDLEPLDISTSNHDGLSDILERHQLQTS